MKTKILFFGLVTVLFNCTNDSNINESSDESSYLEMESKACFPKVYDAYTYPSIPSEAVENSEDGYLTIDEILKYAQLPQQKLKSISTYGLIDALINAPGFTLFNRLSGNSSQLANWHNNYERYNSATELFEKDNSGEKLLSYYEKVCFDCFSSIEESKLIATKEKIRGLEFLFTKKEILDRLSSKQKKQVVSMLIDKYKEQLEQENSTEYWYIALPLACITQHDDVKSIIQYLGEHGSILSEGVISEVDFQFILSEAKGYI